jgi:histidinol-phosphate/aromatic aminotransferase/cobyric acid decarboxylase-like protein
MKTDIEILAELKQASGSHSPSIETILDKTKFKIEVDACFLSNPYATDLFMEHLEKDILKKDKLRDLLEFYPPQNRQIAEHVASFEKAQAEEIFVGNGAIEVIQAAIHRYAGNCMALPIPTFSSYYEYAQGICDVKYFSLDKKNNYILDLGKYSTFIKDNSCSSAVLINPNNPNGAYLNQSDIEIFLEENKSLQLILLDESFKHFAYEDASLSSVVWSDIVDNYPNVVIIKSLSKDFGVAGLRCGYGIMNSSRVNALLKNGYLWNVSGLGAYFFKLLANEEFQAKYEVVRKKYIMNTLMFFNEINTIPKAKLYPSKANFALLEVEGMSSWDLFSKLLAKGVYVRDCSDKIGLEGSFIRVASRSFEENLIIIDALKEVLR